MHAKYTLFIIYSDRHLKNYTK